MNQNTTDLHLPLEVAELKGKYYGTEILDSRGNVVCKIWYHTQFNPSEREEAEKQAHHDRAVGKGEDCNNGWETGCGCYDWYADSHHESQETYELAKAFVEAANAQLS